MSENWNEGYFTDVGYTYGYYREINPVFQRFCLLLRGFSCVESAEFRHCELGFGQGISVNIHAAANPGQYVATDFNPAHSAHANSIAAQSGCGARLYDDSFEQLLNRTDLPQFDSISLHGIWTWVSRENHHLIVEFVRRYLKPGGVLYISYNCFPGWAPDYPLRQLFALHDRYVCTGNETSGRVEAALRFSESLLQANPLYAQAAPNLGKKLEVIKGQNRNYLAHEYFNRDWNCMYFSDVVDALAVAKLDYVTTAVPLDAFDAINLTADGQAFLRTVEHPILREQARDYFVNQQFRKDLYVRGAVQLSPVEHRERMLDTRFVLMQHVDSISTAVRGVLGEATLQQEVYRPLLAAFTAEGYAAKTLRQLSSAVPTMNYPSLQQAIGILVGMGAIAPCQSEADVQQVQGRCVALNRYLCQQSKFGNRIETLASPLTGGGVSVGRFAQLFLLAREQGSEQPEQWAQYVWQVLAGQGQSLIKDGKTLEGAEANLAELTRQAQAFADQSLVVLKALGIA